MGYPDDGRVTIIPPGANLPSAEQGFDWVDTSWRARRRGRALARTIEGHTGGLRISRTYTEAATAYERACQDLEYARQQRALLPLKVERDRQHLHADILQGQSALNRMLQEAEQAAEISAADHQIAMIERKERKLAAKTRLKARKRDAKGMERAAPAPSTSNTPEEFTRAWATEERVRRNRSEADRLIDAIYDRARAERRNLTADEVEEIDALQDSAAAAESEVRRRSASGL